MKVYAVYEYVLGDAFAEPELCEVFATKEKAILYIMQRAEEYNESLAKYRIEDYELYDDKIDDSLLSEIRYTYVFRPIIDESTSPYTYDVKLTDMRIIHSKWYHDYTQKERKKPLHEQRIEILLDKPNDMKAYDLALEELLKRKKEKEREEG